MHRHDVTVLSTIICLVSTMKIETLHFTEMKCDLNLFEVCVWLHDILSVSMPLTDIV